ncbi:uncharacterized protein [Nothobranchius furzeri]|uniref:uncharacterized protein n=1 Tax=Nothobranchius furzeri TaxID=105023 RepID=UPI003904C027
MTAAPPLVPALTRPPTASAVQAVPPTGSAVPAVPPPTASARPSLATAVTKKMFPAVPVTAPKILLSKLIKTCCFCHLVWQKKNLKAHIQRRHSSITQDITANRYLQSVCTDNKRGIFAVVMTFKGPAHYIHVQKCTWGEKPQITCQLDKCNRQYKYAHRSGQVGFDCQHIQSLVYCPVATNLPVAHNEGTNRYGKQGHREGVFEKKAGC